MSDRVRDPALCAARRLASDRDGIVAEVLSAVDSEHPVDGARPDRDEIVECVRSGVEEFLEATALGRPPEDVPAPPGAVASARTLAGRGHPPDGLARASRVCARVLLARFRDVFGSMPIPAPEVAAAVAAIHTRLDAYFDRTCGTLLRVHAAEGDGGGRAPGGQAFTRVSEILDNPFVTGLDADRLLGAPLDRWHVAGVAWVEPGAGPWALRRLDDAVSGALGGPVVDVRPDADTAWFWVSRDERPVPDVPALEKCLDSVAGVRIALGEPGVGLHGFRVSHRQACRTRRVATARPDRMPRVLAHRAVALPALVADRADEVGEWVRPILGDLARDDERTARLRETARRFLASGGDHHETAARLGVHRNTVRNRIAQVEAILGRSLAEDRLSTEAALELCERLGLIGSGLPSDRAPRPTPRSRPGCAGRAGPGCARDVS